MKFSLKSTIVVLLALGMLTGCSSDKGEGTDTSEHTSIFDSKDYDRIGGLYSKYNKEAETYELYTHDGVRVGSYFTEIIPCGDKLLATYGTRNPAVGIFPGELYSISADGVIKTLDCDKVYLVGGFGAVIDDDGTAKVVGSDLAVLGEIGEGTGAFYGGTYYKDGKYGGPAGYYLERNGNYTVVTMDGKVIPGSDFIIEKFGSHRFVVKTDDGYAIYERDADEPSDVGKEYKIMYTYDASGELQKYRYLIGDGGFAQMFQLSPGVYHYAGMNENRFERMVFMGEYIVLDNRVCDASAKTIGTVADDAHLVYEPDKDGGVGTLTAVDQNGTHYFYYTEGKPQAPVDAMDTIYANGEFAYIELGMGGLTCHRVRSLYSGETSVKGTYVHETETVLEQYIEPLGGKMSFKNTELYLLDSYAWLMDDGQLLLSGCGRFVGSDDAILWVPFTTGENMKLYDGELNVVYDDIIHYTRTNEDRLIVMRKNTALVVVAHDGSLAELMRFDEGVPVPNQGFIVRVGEKVKFVDQNGKVIVTLDGWYEGLVLDHVESGDSFEGGIVFIDHDDVNKEGDPKKVIFRYDSEAARYTVTEKYAAPMGNQDCTPTAIP